MRRRLMTRKRLAGGIAVCLVLLGIWSFTRFRHTYNDLTREVVRTAAQLPAPAGVYHQIAWLRNEQVALLYEPTDDLFGWNNEIVLLSLETHAWHTLPVPKPSECRVASPKHVQRLPTGNLGFVYSCLVDRGSFDDEFNSLYEWDVEGATLRLLQRYPENFRAGRFAFSPDMSELLQEQPVGSGLNNELYRGRPPERLNPAQPSLPNMEADPQPCLVARRQPHRLQWNRNVRGAGATPCPIRVRLNHGPAVSSLGALYNGARR
jgi:hypothetical protein